MVALAATILACGPRYVLVKGGHFAERSRPSITSPDILVEPGRDRRSSTPTARQVTRNDHGTGCSLSAAIAAGLALGRSVPDATRDAKSFVLAALSGAAPWRLGQGHGPIDHLGWNE